MNYEVKHPLVALTRCFFIWLPGTKCTSFIVPAPIGQEGAEASQRSPDIPPLRYMDSLTEVNFHSSEVNPYPLFLLARKAR